MNDFKSYRSKPISIYARNVTQEDIDNYNKYVKDDYIKGSVKFYIGENIYVTIKPNIGTDCNQNSIVLNACPNFEDKICYFEHNPTNHFLIRSGEFQANYE